MAAHGMILTSMVVGVVARVGRLMGVRCVIAIRRISMVAAHLMVAVHWVIAVHRVLTAGMEAFQDAFV